VKEINKISDQLEINFRGDAWHGPSVMQLLADVTAEQAAARPVQNAHSIWELVLHIKVWKDATGRRLAGEAFEPTPEEDWPEVTATGEAAWENALKELEASHEKLAEAVSKLDELQLHEPATGEDYSNYFMIHGVIQHDLYHAGQIVLLKKF